MRSLFLVLLVIAIIFAYLNISYLPAKQMRAKEIVDNHIHSLPVTDSDEINYSGHVTFIPQRVYVENLHVVAGYGKWDRTEYRDIELDVESIEYDSSSVLWRNVREIESLDGLKFTGHVGYNEISEKISNSNENLADPAMWYDGGHLFLRSYYVPLKGKLEFDGKLILTPTGDLKYQFHKITNEDQEEITSRRVHQMIEDTTNLTVSFQIMDKRIALDKMEIDETGVLITGQYNIENSEPDNS